VVAVEVAAGGEQTPFVGGVEALFEVDVEEGSPAVTAATSVSLDGGRRRVVAVDARLRRHLCA